MHRMAPFALLAVLLPSCASAPSGGDEISRLERLLLDRERALAAVEARLRDEGPPFAEEAQAVRSLEWVTQAGKVRKVEDGLRVAREKWLPTAPVVLAMEEQLRKERARLAEIPESAAGRAERGRLESLPEPGTSVDLSAGRHRLQAEIEALRTALHLLEHR